MFRSVNLALATRAAAAFFVLWVIGAPSNALAQTSPADEVLTVEVNTGDLVRLSGSAAQVFVADPEVADVQVPNSRSVFVLGLKAGQTTLYALASNGSLLLRRDVQVVHNVTRMKEMIDQALPDNNVVVESMPTGLLITGAVSDAASADQIMLIAQTFVSEEDEIVNQLEVKRNGGLGTDDDKVFETAPEPVYGLVPTVAMDCEFDKQRVVHLGNSVALVNKAIKPNTIATG